MKIFKVIRLREERKSARKVKKCAKAIAELSTDNSLEEIRVEESDEVGFIFDILF